MAAFSVRIAVAIAAVAVSSPSFSDEDVLNFSAGDTVTYDDNLFRVPADTDLASSGRSQRSDIINTTYVGLTMSKQISRQKFIVDAQLSWSRFSEYSDLNNSGRSIMARWLGEVGNHWKNEVSLEESRKLTSFVDFRTFEKNIVTFRRVYGDASYWYHPQWSVLAGASAADNKNSSSSLSTADYRANFVEAGIQFMPPTANQIRLNVRRTEGRYPNRQVVFDTSGTPLSTVDNSYTQDDLDVTADWQLTGASRLKARAGLTRRHHHELPRRDFSGPTGLISYGWAPGAKFSLDVALRREIGATDDVNASYVLTNGISVSPSWTPTAKLSLQGFLDWSRREPRGDPSFVLSSASQQEDRFRTASLTAGYVPLRRLLLSLKVQNQRRDSNVPGLSYKDNLVLVTGNFAF